MSLRGRTDECGHVVLDPEPDAVIARTDAVIWGTTAELLDVEYRAMVRRSFDRQDDVAHVLPDLVIGQLPAIPQERADERGLHFPVSRKRNTSSRETGSLASPS